MAEWLFDAVYPKNELLQVPRCGQIGKATNNEAAVGNRAAEHVTSHDDTGITRKRVGKKT